MIKTFRFLTVLTMLVGALLLVGIPAIAQSTTSITFQQGTGGYTGASDTYIYQYAPTTNYSSNSLLKVGYKQQYAALFRFDLSSIPTDAVITQANLQIYAQGWSGADITMSAYRIIRNVTLSQTTWNQAQNGNPWGTPGCNNTNDRVATAEGNVTTSGINKWYSLDLTSLVQHWVNGSVPNNGVLLRGSSTTTSSFYFASAENSTVNLRPKLVVSYYPGGCFVPGPPDNPSPTSGVSGLSTSIDLDWSDASGATSYDVYFGTTTDPPYYGNTTSSSYALHTLSPNTHYYWKIVAKNSCGETPGPIWEFTTISEAEETTTITLQQGMEGYTGASDTYIYQYAPTTNYSSNSSLKIGYKQQYAALLRFDLSSIPADAVITNATLQLYAHGWNGVYITLGAYRVIRNVTLNQATWNQAQNGNPWGTPGCNNTTNDRVATAEGNVTTSGINRWYSLNLTSLVQKWVNGSLPNNGVLLRGSSSTSTSSVYFASAENSTANLRPKFVITYGSTTPVQDVLIIGHITDVHINGEQSCSQRLPLVLSAVSRQAQLMVDTGDCTEHGTAEETIEYKDLITSYVTIPWRAVQGNHDTPEIFEAYIGPLAWFRDVGSYRLIGINTESIDYTALDQALTTEKPCIVFGHFPLSYCNPMDQVKLRQRFRTYNVPIYIAGHTHENSMETDPDSGTLLLIGRYAGMGDYRLITLRGFEVESVIFKSVE